MDKNKDFLHDLWYVSGVNEDIWSTLIDNYNNATEKDNALEHIKWHLGYKQDDGKLKEIEKKIENSTQVKLTFTAKKDTTVKVYFTKESFDNDIPDNTISLTANEEKTTTYDRESIYTFRSEIHHDLEPNDGNPYYLIYSDITFAKIEGKIQNCNSLFQFWVYLKSVDISKMDTSEVTDMSNMFDMNFDICMIDNSLQEIIGISTIDTSNVIDMSNMFYNCYELTSLDVSKFNTSLVTNMSGMFYNCPGLTILDVTNFNTSNVTNMTNMFCNCRGLTTLYVTNFNTFNVTDMQGMFSGCSELTVLDVTNFDTSKVTNMSFMFAYLEKLTTLDVSNFNTSNVTNMESMFQECKRLTSLNLSNFDTSKVTNMSDMFEACIGLTILNVSNWNTSNVTDMQWMFNVCEKLTTLDVSNWNTSNVTNMNNMFTECSKLTTIGPVDTAPGWQHKPDEYYDMFTNCPAIPKPSWYTA